MAGIEIVGIKKSFGRVAVVTAFGKYGSHSGGLGAGKMRMMEERLRECVGDGGDIDGVIGEARSRPGKGRRGNQKGGSFSFLYNFAELMLVGYSGWRLEVA